MPVSKDLRAEQIAANLVALPAGTPVSEVASKLLDLFTSGHVEPGTRLPAERQLAAILTVGRSAVREALAALEILGIVDVRPGSGTYLRGRASDLLPQTLRWGLLVGEQSTAELLEFRSGLEIYVARLAAARAQPADVAILQNQAAAMRAATENFSRFVVADRSFHSSLERIVGNLLLSDTIDTVRSLLQVYADRAVHGQAHADQAVIEHEEVLDAISSADPDRAASAMAAHMSTASQRLLAAGN